MGFWFAAYVPANTPAAVVNKLHDILVEATKGPAMQQYYTQHRHRSFRDHARRARQIPGRRNRRSGRASSRRRASSRSERLGVRTHRCATSLRLGGGAGFAGDRLDAPVDLAEHGALDYLVLECLAERTIALAQLRRRRDPASGYDARLAERIESLLPMLEAQRDPARQQLRRRESAARRRTRSSRSRVACAFPSRSPPSPATTCSTRSISTRRRWRRGLPLSKYAPIVSANAYLGAEAMLPALASGADIVVTGRVADPSLFVAPLMHEYGWAPDDVDRLARGTAVGHLLECAGQLCGGYFADPGRKDIPDMAHLGFPFADVDADGNAMLGKVAGTGGRITRATATEQLLYEVTDPHGYLTPDVTADFSAVTLTETAPDRVAVRGARGRARPSAAQGQRRLSRGLRRRRRDRLRRHQRDGARATRSADPARAARRAAIPSCASTSSAARRCTAAPSTATSVRTKCACASPRARERTRKPRSSATRSRRCTPTARRAAAARASTSPSRSASCPR